MVAKRSSRALALLLALPSAAFALGLGDIRLLSPLNSPLDAEIDLVDVAPDEANTVQAQLASRETFARYGLDWPGYLAGIQVRTVHTPDGGLNLWIVADIARLGAALKSRTWTFEALACRAI